MSNWFWIGPTLAAILTFLGYALFKYLQGEFNQGLAIECRCLRASISPGQTLLFLEVEARNTSKVPVPVRYMEATLRRLSLYTDDEIGEFYSLAFPSDGSPMEVIPWELIFTIPRHWEEGTCTIQPGESHFESFEFIIPSSYDTLSLHVGIQVVNKPLEPDATFRRGGIEWRRVTLLGTLGNEDVE